MKTRKRLRKKNTKHKESSLNKIILVIEVKSKL